jgi:endonuclease/exonuclease/phosphatase (EEP) superfamily protein YafD
MNSMLTSKLSVCVWLYVALVLVVWLLLRFGGDHWWFATVMLFGPRWVYGLPLVLLVPAAAFCRRRLLWPLAASMGVVLWPIMGLCLPWGRVLAPNGPAIRVLTCNVKGKCANNKALDELINQTLPDIVALQGCWAEVQVRWPAGWHVWKEGEYVVASRYPLLDHKTEHRWSLVGHWPLLDMVHCTVQTPERDVDFFSTHLLSPRDGLGVVLDRQTLLRPSEGPALAADIDQRSQESEDVESWVRGFSGSPILAGDFNMPTDSRIYRRDWAKYRNAFSDAGLGCGYTEWPRIRGFSWGVRIDHVLTGPHWQPRRCWVGPDIGSDHLPLIADLQWTE